MITKKLLSFAIAMLMTIGSLSAQNGGKWLTQKDVDLLDLYEKDKLQNPDNTIPYLKLAEIWFNKDYYDRAMDEVGEAIKVMKENNDYTNWSKAHEMIGDIFVATQDTGRALYHYATSLSADPKNIDALCKRADVYLDKNDLANAKADFGKILAIDKSNKLGKMGMGRTLYAQGKWNDAINCFNFVIEYYPSLNKSAHLFRALCYKEKKEWDLAAKDLVTAYSEGFIHLSDNENEESDNSNSDKYFQKYYWVKLESFLSEKETVNRYIEKLKEMAEEEGDNSMYWVALGSFCQNAQLYSQAIAHYTKANEKAFNNYVAQDLTNCHTKLLQYDKCIEVAKEALKHDSTDYYLTSNLATMLNYCGHYEESILAWDKAIDLKPDNSYYYLMRGKVKSRFDKLAAIDDYTSTIALFCTDGQIYLHRGRLYKELGMEAKATRDFNKALELEADKNNRYQTLSFIYQAIGQNDKAIELMNQSLKAEPKSDGVYYNAACLYSIMNRSQEALDYLEKSLELGYDDFGHMGVDFDLDPIRDLPEYKTLIEKYKTKYLAQFKEE